ncbi:MAG: DUF3868 domain-containing protein [Prevotella sp.]|nr:DUF3868 domain-containing protein [Prevotella sp.]
MRQAKKKMLLLLLSIVCLTSAQAQIAYKGQLYINEERFTLQGNLLRVELRVSYDDDILNAGETLNFTPVLKNGYQVQSLSSVVVNGKERGKYEKRKEEFQNRQRSNIPVVTRDKRHGTRYFVYDTTVPYVDWMHDASLYIECEERGWGAKPHVYEDKLYDRIIISNQPLSTYDNTGQGSALHGTAATTEWVQFLDPSVPRHSELTITGVIPLNDSRKLLNMSEEKFNRAIYDELMKSFETQLQVPGTTVKALNIVGYSAPIGNYKRNEIRAASRALSLKQHLMRNHATGADALTVTWVPEDWDSIYTLVSNSTMKLRVAAMDIIRSVDIARGREDELQMLGDGAPYSYMEHYIFPEVCRLKYTATLSRRAADLATGTLVLRTHPETMTINELYAVALNFKPGSREFNDIIDLSARLFPDNAEANIDAAGVALLRGNITDADKYLSAWRTDPRAYNNLGVMYMLKGDFAKAEVYLQMAQAAGVPQATNALSYLRNVVRR